MAGTDDDDVVRRLGRVESSHRLWPREETGRVRMASKLYTEGAERYAAVCRNGRGAVATPQSSGYAARSRARRDDDAAAGSRRFPDDGDSPERVRELRADAGDDRRAIEPDPRRVPGRRGAGRDRPDPRGAVARRADRGAGRARASLLRRLLRAERQLARVAQIIRNGRIIRRLR